MDGFAVKQINEDAYVINDAFGASFYVVRGSEYAAVIDTGFTKGETIMPVIRSITDMPLKLVITHLHMDHMHHMDEFEEVYMCRKELTMPPQVLRQSAGGVDHDYSRVHNIETGSVVSLGGDELEICQVPGHTPGTVVILDKKHNMLFTGDAIGSGVGVWMQVTSAISLEEYLDSLIFLQSWLVEKGGRMSFWGGHNNQQYTAIVTKDGYNPLNMGLLGDLIDLVEKILTGEIKGVAHEEGIVDKPGENLYASFGRAEILYNRDSLRRKASDTCCSGSI